MSTSLSHDYFLWERSSAAQDGASALHPGSGQDGLQAVRFHGHR